MVSAGRPLLTLLLGLGACDVPKQVDDTADDDGNQTDPDGCEPDCSVAACGNGIVEPGEICYAPAVTLDVSARPLDVEIADIDGDGDRDLVAVIQNDTAPLVSWLGDGAGSLGAAIVSLDDEPHFNGLGLELADLDEDGHLDAIHSGYVSALVAWGQGDGSFELPLVIPCNYVNTVTVGHFDDDNLLDIACASHPEQYDADVYVAHNLGGRSFSDATIIADPGYHYPELTAADLDADGDDDLLAYDEIGVIRVWRQTAPGMFMVEDYPLPVPQGIGWGIATGYLDGDARLDVVASFPRTLTDPTRVVALLQDQQGVLVSEPSVVAGMKPWGLAISDVSSDGLSDMVVALGSGSVAVLAREGAGGFAAPVSFPAGSEPSQVTTGDLDGDGVPELAVANDGGSSVSLFWSDP
jgi:hypothetical protein